MIFHSICYINKVFEIFVSPLYAKRSRLVLSAKVYAEYNQN